MLIRIVHMHFLPEHVATFQALFDEKSVHIRAFPGCHHLELWQRADDGNAFTTYSLWENESALDFYRDSILFRNTWSQTRQWFSAAPVAYSFYSCMTR